MAELVAELDAPEHTRWVTRYVLSPEAKEDLRETCNPIEPAIARRQARYVARGIGRGRDVAAVVKDIRRATRRQFSAEEKIRIVLEGLRGEESIAELFGGGAEIGYNHEFANRLVVGVDAVSGFSPGLFSYGPVRGFDFAATDVRVGYDMGRWMPYVTTGVVLAKPIVGPQANYVNASQSTNELFNAPGNLRAAPTVGAGVDYAVTPNLHLDLSVSGSSGVASPFYQ